MKKFWTVEKGVMAFAVLYMTVWGTLMFAQKSRAQVPFQPGVVLTANQLNQAFATAQITGGTINGATIGGINPGAGRFSSLTTTSAIGSAYGGTGIANNSASTLTLTGPYPLTLTLSGSTSLTLPTSGTVTAKGNTSTGTGSVVLATSPTLTTPNIGDATAISVTASGAVSAGRILTAAPRTITATTYTVQLTDTSIITTTPTVLTLPAAASFSGRMLIVRSTAAQAVTSTPAVIIPLVGGTATTTILAATAGKWAFLHSDGSNWQVMMGN